MVTLASISPTILEEHRQLLRSLTTLDAAVRSPGGFAAKRGMVAGRIVDLRRRLARHFAAEERGGLFERIQRSAPENADVCARLRQQHVAILAGLDRARDEMPSPSAAAAAVQNWEASVRAVLAEIGSHEQREDMLLVAALEGGGGAPD